MEVYVARQPIFDRRMKTYGYELLYRRSQNNFYEGSSDSQATAQLINNAYFAMHFNTLTCGTRAFINFSDDLLEREVPLLLPKKNLVVEVLEYVEPTDAVVAACRKLVSHGYTLALDDYVHREERLPLLELAEIVKIEICSLQNDRQRDFLRHYRGPKRFVAEKLYTQDDYELAHKLGFDFFQGYFFSKPMVIAGREIQRLNASLIEILTELSREEPEYHVISTVIRRDMSLVYKLLRLANSVAYGGVQRIESIELALGRVGLAEFKKWVYLLILTDLQEDMNQEIIKTCLVRGKLMEEIAQFGNVSRTSFPHFLTGLFSSIDIILNRPMSQIVRELLLPPEVSAALLGKRNSLRLSLDHVIALEQAEWDLLGTSGFFDRVPLDAFMPIYWSTLQWVNELL